MKFYIFRHGQTDGNVKNIVQGAGVDCPLNDTGRKQAAILKDKLAACNIPVFYCSKLSRAIETAEIAASSNGAKVIPIDGLEEVHFGEAEGMLSSEAHEKFAEIFAAINDDGNENHDDVCVPGGETVRQSVERFLKALDFIKKDSRHERVGVATHGALMYNLYFHLYGIHKKFDNCECIEIEI